MAQSRHPGPVERVPGDARPPRVPYGKRHRGTGEYSRTALVSDGGHNQRRNTEHWRHDYGRQHVEHAEQN